MLQWMRSCSRMPPRRDPPRRARAFSGPSLRRYGNRGTLTLMSPVAGYQVPRGTRDLLPEEAAAFDALQAVVEARALRYGYPRIITPVVEERGVFIKTSGESSDIVMKEMYDVRLGAGEGDLTLRPEATPAIARAFLNAGLHKASRPQRFFAFEPMFRGQRPQKLRYRQFWQWDIECFGAD